MRGVCGGLVGIDEVASLARLVCGQDVSVDTPLMQGGLDSLGAVELRNRLQATIGDRLLLPTTIIFEAPTIRQLASATAAGRTIMPGPSSQSTSGAASGARVAGASSVLPARAASPLSGWRMVCSGQDVVGEVPSSRWELRDFGALVGPADGCAEGIPVGADDGHPVGVGVGTGVGAGEGCGEGTVEGPEVGAG